MSAPSRWRAPSSGGKILTGSTTRNVVSYANGYWFAVTNNTTTNEDSLRVATDPTGTWTTVSLPAAPSGYNNLGVAPLLSGVSCDGTTWALVVRYANGALRKNRVVYATDPLGTWSSYEYDATDLYQPAFFGYLDGQWVMTGRHLTASPQPGFIATCGTANGTYTFNTSAATTGYDTAALTGTGTLFWDITGLDYDGTTWVSCADQNGGITTSGVRYSTSLTSSWATPSSPPSSGFAGSGYVRYQGNGWWTIMGTTSNAFYADAPSGTWTLLDEIDVSLGDSFQQIVYGNGYWVAAGAYDNAGDPFPRTAYLQTGGAPSGAYTAVDSDWEASISFGAFIWGLEYHDGVFVAANSFAGELRWASLTAPTYLRQRQSPVRAPSRVSWKAY